MVKIHPKCIKYSQGMYTTCGQTNKIYRHQIVFLNKCNWEIKNTLLLKSVGINR